MKIKELKIYTSKIQAQIEFYSTVIGLETIAISEQAASFRIGESILTLNYRKETTPYHFAINIPANKDEEALTWLKSRVEILKDGAHEIQDFDFWNAKAVYFYDADFNIVELIARRNLDNSTDESFGVNQFLAISEIGIPTINIERDYELLKQAKGIEIFSGGFERFLSVGDENGLFICVDKNKKDWFPTNDKAFSSDFEMKFVEQGVEYKMKYLEEEIEVVGVLWSKASVH